MAERNMNHHAVMMVFTVYVHVWTHSYDHETKLYVRQWLLRYSFLNRTMRGCAVFYS